MEIVEPADGKISNDNQRIYDANDAVATDVLIQAPADPCTRAQIVTMMCRYFEG